MVCFSSAIALRSAEVIRASGLFAYICANIARHRTANGLVINAEATPRKGLAAALSVKAKASPPS
jgi:hypothetical protein